MPKFLTEDEAQSILAALAAGGGTKLARATVVETMREQGSNTAVWEPDELYALGFPRGGKYILKGHTKGSIKRVATLEDGNILVVLREE